MHILSVSYILKECQAYLKDHIYPEIMIHAYFKVIMHNLK